MRAVGIHTTGQILRVAELTDAGGPVSVSRLEALPAAGLTAAGAGSDARAPEDRRNGASCCSSLPPFEVLTRVWTLPAVAPVKLRALVSHRLEVDLPIPLEQLVWDCRAARGVEGGSADVLAQAVRRDRVARHVESLGSGDLFPNTVTTEAEGIASLAAHALGLTDSPAPTALVLAGEHEWLLAILIGDLARTVRRLPFDPVDPDAVVREARQVIETECREPRLQRLAWVGEPMAGELLEDLADSLDVPLSAAVADLRDDGGEPLAPGVVAEYGPAIGLALAVLHRRESVIRLGGMPVEAASGPQNRLEALLRYPKHLAVAAAVLLVTALGIHLASLRAETRRMETQLAVATSQPADDLDTKVRAMQRLTQYRIDVEGIMAELAKLLPDSTLISSVQLSRERRLILKGTSKDAKAAFTLADVLGKSPRFTNVRPERVAPAQGGEFTVTADVHGIRKLTGLPGRGTTW